MKIGITIMLLAFLCGIVFQEAGAATAFPLKVSANKRYFVDQNNIPFLVTGDSPQGITVDISLADADFFLANRHAHGFNAVWINLLAKAGMGGRADGSTFDGILPFTTVDDLSKPNEPFFARCDSIFKLAAKYDILVVLDPAETIDHLSVLNANGVTKCRSYGRYLGARYKNFKNIVWMSGNDYGTWTSDPVVQAVALGIKDSDQVHLHSVELYNHPIGSHDDPSWEPIIDYCSSYPTTGWSYDLPTYAQVLKDYNNSHVMPVIMAEGAYDHCGGWNEDYLRRQEYWSILSGATGQMYGNNDTYLFNSCWKSSLDAPSNVEMAYLKAFFESRAWYNMVPDSNHAVVTSGYGNFGAATLDASDYVTTASTPDSSLMISYFPVAHTIAVNMAKFRPSVKAQWFDPSNGTYTTVAGSPFANTGSRNFTSPAAANHDGDGDYVLVLETGNGAGVESALQANATLHLKVSPNPARTSAKISLSSAVSGSLKIYDAAGRCVAALNTDQTGNAVWKPAAAPEGLYFVSAKAGGKSVTWKLMVVR